MNDNKIRVFNNADGSIIPDPDDLLSRVEQIRFSTGYPGGIFEVASFFIPCDPTRYSPLRHTQMVQIKNGLVTVWEGFITSITLSIGADRMGFDVQATGYWGLAFKRYKYNRWIDRRFSSNIYGVWNELYTPLNGTDTRISLDQSNQIKLSPQSAWSYHEGAALRYRTNGANKVKRVKFDWELGTVAEINPTRVKFYDSSASTYTANLTDTCDGNPTTDDSIVIDTGDYLYISTDDPEKVSGLRFDIGPFVNPTASVMTLEYYGEDASWHTITKTDGTAAAGATLTQSGTVSFTAFDGWGRISINGTTPYYYMRISVSVVTFLVQINDIYVLSSQSWEIALIDNENDPSGTLWDETTAGSGSQDITLATTSNDLWLRIRSLEAQIVIGSGVYGKIDNLAMVSENHDGTSGTTVNYLMKALVHYLGDPFLDDYTYIAANTYDLLTTGFVADDFQKPIAQQMIDIGRASATDVAYSVGVLESEAIGGTNYKPVIYYEQVPLLTDYDYALRLDEDNISGVDLVLSSDFDELFNSVITLYADDNGKQDWASVSDYAGLDDAASQTKYLKRTLPVDVGSASTSALAGALGAVYLTNKKNLAYYMRGPLQIRGTIRKKDGSRVAVSMVRAGKRIRIENFSADIGDVIGAGLTFLISRTEYDDESGVMSITTGVGDDLAQYLAWREATGK